MNTLDITRITQHEINTLVSYFNQKQFSQMESYALKLTARFPHDGLGWQAIGVARNEMGRFPDALKPLQTAAKLLPRDSQPHNNLAVTYAKLGRFVDAEASYTRALELSPTLAEAHFNRGKTLYMLDRLEEAEACYRKALTLKPGFVEALNSLALYLMSQGKYSEALGFAYQALKTNESTENKFVFAKCLKDVSFTAITDDLRSALIRAISEPWIRSSELAGVGATVIKLNPEINRCIEHVKEAWPRRLTREQLYSTDEVASIAKDQVFLALLNSAPVCDFELEKFLTALRHSLLEAAGSPNHIEPNIELLQFYGAIASQCYSNEYVFSWTKDEAERAQELRDRLIEDLQNNRTISTLRLVTVASYFPLGELPHTDRLMQSVWPAPINTLLTRQIREPKEEASLRHTIPQLTPISNEISLLVQNQYEENPYPRWVKSSPTSSSSSIDEYIKKRFPLSPYQPALKNDRATILVAGCGTGQQSIEASKRFNHSQLLAIDLSMASLSYAMRNTLHLGINSISYAQADIMRMGEIDRKFDLIESSGVLHHLEDPMEGWRALVSRLRFGGVMRLGLYSAVARRNIMPARELIKEHGYGSSAEDIRQYRQFLINMDGNDWLSNVIQSRDFFSTSTCRDMLSHVQEHHMNLTEINAFLKKNKLRFIGFEIDQNVIYEYRKRFPGDQAAINLANWQIFENENPDTFLEMYQFWVQKMPS